MPPLLVPALKEAVGIAGSELSPRKKCPFAVKALPFYRLKDVVEEMKGLLSEKIESCGGIYLTNEEGGIDKELTDSGHGEETEDPLLAAVAKLVIMLEEERL